MTGKARKNASERSHHRHVKKENISPLRLVIVLTFFFAGFLALTGRVIELGLRSNDFANPRTAATKSKFLHRPNIIDRNGRLLANDVMMPSLFANPSKISSPDEATEKLRSVFPELNAEWLRKTLTNKAKQFVWIKHGLTPAQRERTHNLGLAGFGFRLEPNRFYPAGATAGHVLGFVDSFNRGLAGIERYIDEAQSDLSIGREEKRTKQPIQLALDLGVQHILRQELINMRAEHQGKWAGGIILDVMSGEVIAMGSVPDYDANDRSQLVETKRFDRLMSGTYELGSVMKVVTAAMALDLGTESLDSQIDAIDPIKLGRFTIKDYHPQRRILTFQQVFTYSSNIGTARIADKIGPEKHKRFLKRLGLLDPMTTELGDIRTPRYPNRWSRVHAMTISYGHGIALSPFQFVANAAALVNGGRQIRPAFLKKTHAENEPPARQIVKHETSVAIRNLLRANVETGTGKRANVSGFLVGGKTGTAEKVVGGVYDKDRLTTSFLSVFPTNNPGYIMLIMLDEPQPIIPTRQLEDGRKVPIATKPLSPVAGHNVAPATAKIISQIAPLLGVSPSEVPLSGPLSGQVPNSTGTINSR